MGEQPHIVILGAGFAGLAAARKLRQLLPRARVRLVAARAQFIYLPSLIWIPIGLRRGQDLVLPLGPILARHALDFTQAHVTGLAEGGRRVLTDRGPLRNDALILAAGAHSVPALPGGAQVPSLCAGPEAAQRIGDRLRALDRGRIVLGCDPNPAEPAALRAGPTFELAFGIDTWLRRLKRRERFELSLFSALPEPARQLGASAVARIDAELARRGIALHAGRSATAFSAQAVHFGEERLAADLAVYTPGLSGPDWATPGVLPLSPGGFVLADEYAAVPGLERVYAAGDVASFAGPQWSPKLAHMAQLQAALAAVNLAAELGGSDRRERLRHEIAYVLDTLDAGLFVHRTAAHAVSSRPLAPLHWAKRAVERRYLAALQAQG